MGKIDIINTINFYLFIFFIFQIFQDCNYNDDKNLGDGFVYFADHKMISNINGSCGEIPSNVLEYKHDKKFIVATQKPIENDPNVLLYDTAYYYKQGYDNIYYWIILKDFKKVIGPLTEDEFLKAIIKYKVSKTLKL
jgi:hypothetical protein